MTPHDAEWYAKLTRQAEDAVKDVVDPGLRKIAFKKILDDLLKRADPAPGPQN